MRGAPGGGIATFLDPGIRGLALSGTAQRELDVWLRGASKFASLTETAARNPVVVETWTTSWMA